MGIRDIKLALVARTQPLPSIGNVWNRLRYNVDSENIREYFGVDDPDSQDRGWSIRAWMWYRHGRPVKRENLEGDAYSLTHQMMLWGLIEEDDERDSETEVNELCDLITAQFASATVLEDVAFGWTLPALVRDERITLVGLYHCHDIELTMDVTEFIDPNEIDGTFLYRH